MEGVRSNHLHAYRPWDAAGSDVVAGSVLHDVRPHGLDGDLLSRAVRELAQEDLAPTRYGGFPVCMGEEHSQPLGLQTCLHTQQLSSVNLVRVRVRVGVGHLCILFEQMGIHILLNEYTERECVYIQRRSMGIRFEQMDIHIHLNVYTPLKQMSIPFEPMCIHITHPSTPATISAALRGGASRGDVPRHRGWTRLSSCSA